MVNGKEKNVSAQWSAGAAPIPLGLTQGVRLEQKMRAGRRKVRGFVMLSGNFCSAAVCCMTCSQLCDCANHVITTSPLIWFTCGRVLCSGHFSVMFFKTSFKEIKISVGSPKEALVDDPDEMFQLADLLEGVSVDCVEISTETLSPGINTLHYNTDTHTQDIVYSEKSNLCLHQLCFIWTHNLNKTLI